MKLQEPSITLKEYINVLTGHFTHKIVKVLHTLIQSVNIIYCPEFMWINSSKVMFNPSMSSMIKRIKIYMWFITEMLKEPITEQEIDATALKQLCDMGFPENRARKALLLNESVHGFFYLSYRNVTFKYCI
jgi:hypothetical protein